MCLTSEQSRKYSCCCCGRIYAPQKERIIDIPTCDSFRPEPASDGGSQTPSPQLLAPPLPSLPWLIMSPEGSCGLFSPQAQGPSSPSPSCPLATIRLKATSTSSCGLPVTGQMGQEAGWVLETGSNRGFGSWIFKRRITGGGGQGPTALWVPGSTGRSVARGGKSQASQVFVSRVVPGVGTDDTVSQDPELQIVINHPPSARPPNPHTRRVTSIALSLFASVDFSAPIVTHGTWRHTWHTVAPSPRSRHLGDFGHRAPSLPPPLLNGGNTESDFHHRLRGGPPPPTESPNLCPQWGSGVGR